jgi:hypothetical protein
MGWICSSDGWERIYILFLAGKFVAKQPFGKSRCNWKVDRTGSGSCLMEDIIVSCVETSDFTRKVN